MKIEVQNLTYTYKSFGSIKKTVLRDINFCINPGEFVAIVGPSGSGKTTLAQHLTGLLHPDSGRVLADGADMNTDKKVLDRVRQKVGLVFQFPESQLFAETVFDDIAFAPRNRGLNENEVKKRVDDALQSVELENTDLIQRSPHTLSTGEKRRVAIAGVLAMQPEIMLLDEPTAGLDAAGRRALIRIIHNRYVQENSIIIVSHDLQLVLSLANRIVILHQGRIVFDGTRSALLSHQNLLEQSGLTWPRIMSINQKLYELKMINNRELFNSAQIKKALDRHLAQTIP
jgi:energy-coupling factor transport system ATP-binding protein